MCLCVPIISLVAIATTRKENSLSRISFYDEPLFASPVALRYIGVPLYSVSDSRIASAIYLIPVAQIFCVFQAFLD